MDVVVVPPAFLAIGLVLGLLVGSFLNVVIHRVPRGESVVFPGSHCPSCDAAIRPWDNLPVLSWLLLRGRCRACRRRPPRWTHAFIVAPGLVR